MNSQDYRKLLLPVNLITVWFYSWSALLFKGFSPLLFKAFLLDLDPKLAHTFCVKPLFVYGWSALLFKSFLLDLGSKFAYFWL
jgi:hypothetical protein